MKVNALNLAALACVGMAPATVAVLGTSCIKAFNAVTEVPGLLIEHAQQQVCAAGCKPTIETWNHDVKQHIVAGIVDDGARYCEASEGKDKFTHFIDQYFHAATAKCKGHLEGGQNLCDNPETLQPFVKCVKGASSSVVSGSMGGLLPHMNEKTCKKAAEYFTGNELWDQDFPKHVKAYVDLCPGV